jgi:FYVE, RhoGEF and PH domain containing 1
VNERLAGMIDLINPTRELVKEGKIIRISARDGDHIERYLFLFNDLLLVCQSLPIIIGSKQQFKIKSKIDVEGLQVFEAHNLETPNTFYVQGQQKSIELHTSSDEEKMEWQNALETVIAEHNKTCSVRRASIILGNQVDREIIGKVPPVWIKDQETSMCMNCTTNFTTFRRRHHCRACGHVICGKCSSHKAPLIYNDNIVSRVCDPCFEILCPVDHRQSKALQSQASVRSPQQQQQQPQQHQPQHKKLPVILQVKASDPSVISSYLHISCNKKTWLRRWFSVRNNFVLYSFKAHQDVVALTSLPLPGYKVVPVEPTDGIERENTLKIFHAGDSSKVYYLQTEDETSFNRWIDILQKVVLLEIPPAEKQPEVAHTFIPDDMDSSRTPTDC